MLYLLLIGCFTLKILSVAILLLSLAKLRLSFGGLKASLGALVYRMSELEVAILEDDQGESGSPAVEKARRKGAEEAEASKKADFGRGKEGEGPEEWEAAEKAAKLWDQGIENILTYLPG